MKQEKRFLVTFTFVTLPLISFVSFLQAQHHSAPGGEMPPMLLSGLGTHSHPINTHHLEAQKFFDQGLVSLFGFNRYEALRSFRRASEIDPSALMPYWGMAMAQGPHINMDLDGDVQMKESCQAAASGQKLTTETSERERAYLDAVAARCPEYQPAAYQKAMRELVQKYPDDLDAAVLYAESLMIPTRWKWWGRDGKPAEGMEEAVAVLEGVMRRDPNHPGANHFYIHSIEMSPWPERGIPSAQRLMGAVPAAGHLVHMPGHIWMRVGEYELAADINVHAASVDQDYMQVTGVSGSAYAGYYVHNLHFVVYGRSMQGRKEDTIAAARKLAAVASPYVGVMPMMVDAFIPAPLFALMRYQEWDQILGMPSPAEELKASKSLWHWGRAVAFAAKGKHAEALAEKQSFERARQVVQPDWIWLNNKARDILAIAAALLDARLAASDPAAIVHWQRAVAAEDALTYDEPPPWFYPVRESLGGALLRAGKPAEAEAIFREGLQHTPRNGRMLFGLMESLRAQGRMEAFQMVQKEFEAAWKNSDITLRLEDL
jgi:tetratricopeptide (TPR) repeat protein